MRHRQNLVGGLSERCRLGRDRTFHLADHRGLAVGQIAGAAAGCGRDEARRQRGRGALHGRCDGCLLQIGDHAHQRQRLGCEGIAARGDRSAVRNQFAHLGEALAALFVQAGHALAGVLHLLAEAVELSGHLGQELHHGARSGSARQRAQQHAAEHQAASAGADHMRHELHHEDPERIDADRNRDRVDHGGEEHGGRTAVEQFTDTEIGVDAGRERQDRGGQLEGDFEPANAIGQQHGCGSTRRGGLRRGSGV